MPLPIRDTSHLHAEIERLTAENERLREILGRALALNMSDQFRSEVRAAVQQQAVNSEEGK